MRFFYHLTGLWELPLLPPIKALVRHGFCHCHDDVRTDINVQDRETFVLKDQSQ